MSKLKARPPRVGPRATYIPMETLRAAACDRAVRVYARNLLAGTALASRRVPSWRQAVGLDLVRRVIAPGGQLADADAPARLRAWLRAEAGRLRAPLRPDAPLGRNLRLVGRLVGLAALELRVLEFVVVHQQSAALVELTDIAGEIALGEAARLIAVAIAAPEAEVARALAPSGRLVASGLISTAAMRNRLENKVDLHHRLLDVVQQPDLDAARILGHFLAPAPAPTLEPADYPHLGAEVALAQRLLEGALASGRRGVNLLFWGATGSGKTELARVVAAAVGARLHLAGAANDDGEAATPRERLSSLVLGHRLLERSRAILLFDEAEDVFDREWRFGAHGEKLAVSKQWFNLLLESNPVPTIWVANRVCGLDPAFLRRFTYALEHRSPGPAQRRRVWARHLGPARAPAELDFLAERFELNAGQIGGAVAAGAMMSGGAAPDLATLEKLVTPLERLLTGRRITLRQGPERFLGDSVNTPVDLEEILAAAEAWRPGGGVGLSLCLYGPPGTGKSAFVRHLARRMGRRVLLRRASDLLGPYVGETEQKIAEAFALAEAEDAVLLFDEVDSFLRDRRAASQRWEVSEANEMLQQLEAFGGVVACTTNLFADLDQAALRRFVWKIPFRFLRPEQSLALFARVLAPLAADATDPARVAAALGRLPNLAPGDFAVVERRARALAGGGRRPTVAALLADLVAEAGAKERSTSGPGFRPQPAGL